MAEDAVERAHGPSCTSPRRRRSSGRDASRRGTHDDEEMPRVALTRRRVILFAVFVAGVDRVPVLRAAADRRRRRDASRESRDGDHAWLAAALAFEVLSIVSYVALFHGIHVPPGSPLTHRDSYLITMAGLAATRLFAAGGAGGVALTAWALRRSGMERREVAERMIAFLVAAVRRLRGRDDRLRGRAAGRDPARRGAVRR